MNQLKGQSKINVVALEGKGYCLAEFGSTAVTEIISMENSRSQMLLYLKKMFNREHC